MTLFLTGAEHPGRPSIGAWLSYELGTLNRNLPTFVVLTSRDKEASCGQIFYDYYWGSGFLPTVYQGVQFRVGGDPVLYLSNPPGVSADQTSDALSAVNQLNKLRLDETGDPEIVTRIASYEMAGRMQATAPAVMDLTKETKETLDAYGAEPGKPSFANACLLARRMVERGVRFVQIMDERWDQHGN